MSLTQTGFKAIATDGINILYNKNHLVATVCLGDQIRFADSVGGQISDHVKRLIRQLYSKHVTTSGYISVEVVVPVEKQPNGSNCSVYASAFAFELALGSTSMDREYGPSMRQHPM